MAAAITYAQPGVNVFNDLSTVPQTQVNVPLVHVSGPHAQLVRYNVAEEQAEGFLGFYDPLLDHEFAWPNLVPGGLLDPTYTKIWVKNAILKYFAAGAGTGDSILVASQTSLRSSVLSFASNGVSFPRSNVFNDRDVTPGDIIRIDVVVASVPTTYWTYVAGVKGDTVASSIASATSDSGNQGTQSLTSSAVQVAGLENCIEIGTTAGGYDGSASGNINETYDLLVTQSSAGGVLSTAKIRVLSGSGTDDSTVDISPGNVNVAFPVGTRGLLGTFSLLPGTACSESSVDQNISFDDLLAGQRFRITVHQAWTATVATDSGTFAGPQNTTYIATVTRGGPLAGLNPPQITVTTNNGADARGPVNVTSNAAVACGTQGVLIAFSGTSLRAGDRFYIVATAATQGAMHTILLGHALPTTVTVSLEVGITLYIKKLNMQLPQDQIGFAPTTNWDQDQDAITIHAGAIAYDPTWTSGGVQLPLPLDSNAGQNYGGVYVEYRAWQQILVGELGSINDASLLSNTDNIIPGALDPDNPLKYGVFSALLNSANSTVYFTAVADPNDVNKWIDILSLLLGRREVGQLVPLTHNLLVQELYAAHVLAQSTPEADRWRRAWFVLQGVPKIPIVSAGSTVVNHTQPTTSDGHPALATITADPSAPTTAYTIVTITSNNVTLVELGVKAGDILRALYTVDGFGNTTWSEFPIAQVLAENQFKLVNGPNAAVNVPAKIEIWRNLQASDEAVEIYTQTAPFKDQTISCVWPDVYENGASELDGFFLCCAQAGLASGILPQQGMTNMPLAGATSVQRTTKRFNQDQLNLMAGNGVHIITQDPSGAIFARHALTTAPYALISLREEMMVRNRFSVNYRFYDIFAPLIGKANVTRQIIALIETLHINLTETLKAESATQLLGGQILDAQLVSVQRHPILLDRIVIISDIDYPVPLNNLDVHLVETQLVTI